MKNAKKLLCLALALVMTFALVACSGNAPKEPEEPEVVNDPEIEKYVEENGDDLVSGLESGFSQAAPSGCESSIKVEGTEIIIECNMNGVDNVPQENKDQMQAAYDSMTDVFKTSLQPLKDELKTLTAVVVNVNEEDGDLLAKINIKF